MPLRCWTGGTPNTTLWNNVTVYGEYFSYNTQAKWNDFNLKICSGQRKQNIYSANTSPYTYLLLFPSFIGVCADIPVLIFASGLQVQLVIAPIDMNQAAAAKLHTRRCFYHADSKAYASVLQPRASIETDVLVFDHKSRNSSRHRSVCSTPIKDYEWMHLPP